MTARRDPDLLIRAFLDEGQAELPDRAYEAVRAEIDQTRQRVVIGPWRVPNMSNFGRFAAVAAGVLVVAVVGAFFLSRLGGGGVAGPGQSPTPSPSPTASPTAPSSPTETQRSDPEGDLPPGTYAAHPLPSPDDSLTLTFTVPEGWSGGGGDVSGLSGLFPAGDPGVGPPGGMLIMFDDVNTLNGDPCDWSGTADDVSVGPAVDDLVEALLAQTAYEVSDPVDVTIGGYSGKRVDIVHPTEPFAGETSTAPECDQGNYRLWSTAVHGPQPVYGQGPANRWQTNILDVDGTRLVMVAMDFPGTLPADRAELDAIIDSLVIAP